jgi:hypothetical protein
MLARGGSVPVVRQCGGWHRFVAQHVGLLDSGQGCIVYSRIGLEVCGKACHFYFPIGQQFPGRAEVLEGSHVTGLHRRRLRRGYSGDIDYGSGGMHGRKEGSVGITTTYRQNRAQDHWKGTDSIRN